MIQTHDRIGERLRIIGNQNVFGIAQMHAFHRARCRDHRLTVRHAQIDLAFHACAIAKRCDRDPAAVHKWIDVGDMPMHDHARQHCQRFDLWWRMAADAVKLQIGKLRADPRKDFRDEPQHGVDVGRMTKATHEHQVTTLGEGLACTGNSMQIRQQFNTCIGCILMQ